MRLSDQQIDNLDRRSLVNILYSGQGVMKQYEDLSAALNANNKQLEEVNARVEQMKKGPSYAMLILVFVVAWVFSNFYVAIAVTALVAIVYYFVNKNYLSINREQRAEKFYNDNAPQIIEANKKLDSELNRLACSDEAYNIMQLVPDAYGTSDKVAILADLINQRRARNVSEAISVYENMEHQKRLEEENKEHQKRMEEIQREQLKATQEATEAQKQAANAATKLAKEQVEISKTYAAANASVDKKKNDHTKRCPQCKEMVRYDANVCPYCHYQFK